VADNYQILLKKESLSDKMKVEETWRKRRKNLAKKPDAKNWDKPGGKDGKRWKKTAKENRKEW
jgi:hypothetical protein